MNDFRTPRKEWAALRNTTSKLQLDSAYNVLHTLTHCTDSRQNQSIELTQRTETKRMFRISPGSAQETHPYDKAKCFHKDHDYKNSKSKY